MDPIIRSAAVSPVARQIGRQAQALVAPTAPPAAVVALAAPAVAAVPAVPANAAVSPSALVAAALAKPSPAPSAADPKLEATLRERDAHIALLQEGAAKVKGELAALQADAEKRGFASGEAKGEKAALELVQGQLERLKSLINQVGQARQQVMDNAEDALVEIAFAAVCRVLGEQGASHETVQRLVREAGAGARDQLTVRVHPDDAALLRAAPQDMDADVRVVADAGVVLGGCIVDSGTGSLDARFETQLELLGAALLAVRAARHAGQGGI